MEIEYAYSFKENIFYTGMGMIRFYLWFIPGYFVYRFIKVRKSVSNITLIFISLFSLIYWEYSDLNNRFVKLTYDPEQVVIVKKSGELVKIPAGSIKRFWSISIGRSGGWSCYLLIKTAEQSYNSLIVRKREHSCASDAEDLNAAYRKN